MTLASFSDWKWRKVKNYIIIPYLLAGFGMSLYYGGPGGLLDSILAAAAVFAILFPFFYIDFLGAGDVKFTMAVASFIGMDGLYKSMVPIAAASLLVMLAMAAYHRSFKNLKIPMIIPISIGVVLGGLF